jgi:hypothetical protein
MTPAISIGLIEALECSLIILALCTLDGVRKNLLFLLLGVFLGTSLGATLTHLPIKFIGAHDTYIWSTLRSTMEVTVFILPLLVLALGRQYTLELPKVGLLILGIALSVFDARLAGMHVREISLLSQAPLLTNSGALIGAALGFGALYFIRHAQRLKKFFSPASALLVAGTLRLLTGGVRGVDEVPTIESLRIGIQGGMRGLAGQVQDSLMLMPHEFLSTDFQATFAFMGAERLATVLLILLIAAPPVIVLMSVLSGPDPLLAGVRQAAERRLRQAFFRTELIQKGAAPLISFFLVLAALHMANASINPMSEPPFTPIAESKKEKGFLSISVSGPDGDLSDGALRKFSYRYGDRTIRFMALMKPDGTVGVGLDECEICKPPEWNVKARGYAQRGETLVCKYCTTPVPSNALNMPGGCNPIPVEFTLDGSSILIETGELIRVWRETQKLEKKGTHL